MKAVEKAVKVEHLHQQILLSDLTEIMLDAAPT